MWPPTPPTDGDDGRSTVETTGEVLTKENQGVPAGTVIGMGFRVPMFIVSPWTRVSGGAVYVVAFIIIIICQGKTTTDSSTSSSAVRKYLVLESTECSSNDDW